MITNFNVAVDMANKVADQNLMENVKMIEEATENRALALCRFYLKYGEENKGRLLVANHENQTITFKDGSKLYEEDVEELFFIFKLVANDIIGVKARCNNEYDDEIEEICRQFLIKVENGEEVEPYWDYMNEELDKLYEY